MKIGFAVNNLKASQLAFSLLSSKHPLYIFTKEISTPCIINTQFTTCWFDMYSYDGIMVATDMESAKFILNLPNNQCFFYIWYLEWLRAGKEKDYIKNLEVLQNSNLKLIARSPSHANIIENYTNREVAFCMEDANVEVIKKYYE